jgi:thiamine pyrophosphokinase
LKALILVNGEINQTELTRQRIGETKFGLIIGADWGCRHARELGVEPEYVVGDLDSIPDTERASYEKIELVTHPAEKDETDLELALLYAIEKGAEEIVMVGAMGGRMDMTISNVLIMCHPKLAGHRIEIWEGNQSGWLIRPPGEEVKGCAGDTLSLLPLTDNVADIRVEGLKYPLRRERLVFGEGRGLSNVMTSATAQVSFSTGLVLAVHTPGRA